MTVFIGSTSDGKTTKISKLKRGDIFRKVGGKTEYIYQGKERSYDKWGDYKGYAFTWQKWDDINSFGETRKDISVEVDFTF
jgi:hypothetical protein